MADRYTYLPMIGISVAICWALRDLAAISAPLARVLPLAGLAAAVALTAATHRQVSHWRDGRALLEHALAVTESNFLAHNNLGTVLQARGLERARGDLDGAEREYRIALERRPRFGPALTNMGNVLARRGDLRSAVMWYERALASDPDHAEAHGNLGFALARLGRDVEAEPHLRLALELRPELVETEATLALLLTRMGRRAEAIPHYRSVLARRPDRPELANNLAWILATRDGSPGEAGEAVRLAEQAARATRYESAAVLTTLAAAYARAGRLEEAVRFQERAIELSEPGGREGLRRALARYRAGQALSEE
jgi:Tfp pilus assembly protein PilF